MVKVGYDYMNRVHDGIINSDVNDEIEQELVAIFHVMLEQDDDNQCAYLNGQQAITAEKYV